MLKNIGRVVVLSVALTLALNACCFMFHVIIPNVLVILVCIGSFVFASWASHRNQR